jgi:hypothetical protein
MNNKNDIQELEECVMCNEITDVKKTTHIDYRYFYVEGAGQLCKKCYDKTYKEN